ncbi:hypothetical protein DSO57_1013770 [Entomophthora muscae]|uniref:Uncharacterized protein n=1 Tax=Entomophthora muscae TaxID=34485 RepID=A0ACC2S7D6_9FUNG|nr:hypothetical protein DSO57_1013770 [Entomophthora muscae]
MRQQEVAYCDICIGKIGLMPKVSIIKGSTVRIISAIKSFKPLVIAPRLYRIVTNAGAIQKRIFLVLTSSRFLRSFQLPIKPILCQTVVQLVGAISDQDVTSQSEE